ncbi:MAG: hypothetical protein MZV70_13375 [Desulfobacterales bacterium]|nr:hypothetical protein [Desulfobacterales bacterium]
MDRLRDELLSRAAFPEEEDIRPRRGHPVYRLEDLLHPVGVADDVFDAVPAPELVPEVSFSSMKASSPAPRRRKV